MNKHVLDEAVQDYIHTHLNADVNQIALSKNQFSNVSSAELSIQITAKKKSEKKLPTWFNTPGIYYPPALSIEQTSSEITAKYKATLVKPGALMDLTGGFGVDAYYFSRCVEMVDHFEINADLSEIAAHNAQVLQADHIRFTSADGIEWLKHSKTKYDTIYIDPARRSEKGKVFMLKDCSPDVPANLDLLQDRANRLIIKTAPLLDISAGLSELGLVSQVHIVSVKNECKELLWVIDQNYTGKTEIIAVTLNEKEKKFSFTKEEAAVEADFAAEILPGAYLYEPDAALLKSGAFNLIGKRYRLQKLQDQSQLYYSKNIHTVFPGRIFEIEEILTPKDLKKEKSWKANIIVRNYPANAEDLAQKYKIKSDQHQFLLFTKNMQEVNLIFKCRIIQYY